MEEYLLSTFHSEWKLLRAEADEDSSPIDLTSEGDYANKPAAAVEIPTNAHGGSVQNKVAIIFCGGAAANKTFTYKIYGWRRDNGPAELVCTGNGTLGTQAVVKYPPDASIATDKFWADTLTCTSRWIQTASSTDAVGNNEVAKISFDLAGLHWLFAEISSADGSTGTEAGDISAYFASY